MKTNFNFSGVYKTEDTIYCPLCGEIMQKRSGRRGEFYGCSMFFKTGCKGTRQIHDVENNEHQTTGQYTQEQIQTLFKNQNEKVEPEKQIDLIDTSKFPHMKFKFEKFNPVQSEVFSFYDKDINCVVAASTSAGKTTVAEMFMSDSIAKGKKAIFLSPLKAVSQEKYDDWTNPNHAWSKYNVSILTGDYQLTDKRVEELNNANIIILTTEMLDSRTRRIEVEKNNWLLEVGTLVQDECFPKHTQVLLENNFSLSIKEIYENPNINYVMSYNEEKKLLEKKKILRKIKNPPPKEGFVNITYEVNGETKKLTCTSNHKIWTIEGYKQAKDLKENDTIKFFPLDKSLLLCNYCGKSFKTRLAFTSHYYNYHVRNNKNAFHCEICNKTYSRLCDFNLHKNQIHMNKKKYTCICGEEFKSTCSITKHIRDEHDENFPKKYGSDKRETTDFLTFFNDYFYNDKYLNSEKKIKCDVCNCWFSSKKILNRHIKKQHNETIKYICDICKLEFINKKELSLHNLHKHNEDYKQKCIESRKKINYKELQRKRIETCKKRGVFEMFSLKMKKNNPSKRPEVREKISKTWKKKFYEKSKEEQDKIRQNFINAPIRSRGKEWKPTSLEQKIIHLGFPEVAYTGDGKFWLNIGRKKDGSPWYKNPDFKIRNQRKVIEVGNVTFWHTKEEIEETIKAYESKNFKCLYLTNFDIEDNWKESLEKIKTFIYNHEGIVKNVKNFGSSATNEEVYNLEVEDNHNYVANNVLVSNCHLLTVKGRGDRAESAIMRFTKQNPSCRIVFLSATMPNVDELARWLSSLNGKKSELINSSYRPIQLGIHYEQYYDRGNYPMIEANKIEKTMEIAMKKYKENEQVLIFVHTKKTGFTLKEKLIEKGIKKEEIDFHSSDLDLKKRIEIEAKTKSKEIKILIATSTLAWGVNI